MNSSRSSIVMMLALGYCLSLLRAREFACGIQSLRNRRFGNATMPGVPRAAV
jgi:hypothetical protein